MPFLLVTPRMGAQQEAAVKGGEQTLTFSPGDDGTGVQQTRVPGAGIPAPVVQDELHGAVEDGHGHNRSVRGSHTGGGDTRGHGRPIRPGW